MEDEARLAAALNRNNELLLKRIQVMEDWKLPLRNGILAGIGSAIGATLIISILVWLMKPFQAIEPLKPALERLTDVLERRS